MMTPESDNGLKKAKSLEKEKRFAEAAVIYESFLDRPEIAMKLGDWYRTGKVKGVPTGCQILKDEEKAIIYYNKALRIPDAYTKIGCILLNDRSNVLDEERGITYCEQGIYNGSLSAYSCLSEFYYRKHEYGAAFQKAIRGARAGDIESIALLGLLFSTRDRIKERDGFDTDYRMAARCLDVYLYLDGNNRKAINRYAWLLSKKLIDVKEFPSSLNALLKSAIFETPASIVNVAEMFRTGRYGMEQNVDLAAKIIEHYYRKKPDEGAIAERYVMYALLGLSKPIDYSEIHSIFESCSKISDDFRLLIGFILYHGINCKIDLTESKKMFESINPNNSVATLYLDLIEMRDDPSVITYLQNKIKNPDSNRLVQMLSSYNLATWLMKHPQSLNSYDAAWTLLNSIHIEMPFVNLLPITSSIAKCKKMVKNIDDTNPWVAIPLKKSIRIRDPEAQEIYADYIKNTDPYLAILYYRRSARCGNIDSKDKLDMLESKVIDHTDDDNTKMKIDFLTKRIQESTNGERNRLIFLKKYLESDVETILNNMIKNANSD